MNNWTSIISDLRGTKLTLEDIGTAIGLATSTVGDLASGRSKSPRGDAAIKLHALHIARCKPKRSRQKSRKAAMGAP